MTVRSAEACVYALIVIGPRIMLIKSSVSIPSSEITDKRLYMDRRTSCGPPQRWRQPGRCLAPTHSFRRAAGVAWKETGERQGEQLQH